MNGQKYFQFWVRWHMFANTTSSKRFVLSRRLAKSTTGGVNEELLERKDLVMYVKFTFLQSVNQPNIYLFLSIVH